MTTSVYLVEDDPHIREFVAAAVAGDPGMTMAGTAATFRRAVSAMDGLKVNVLIVDLGLPDGNGIDLIRRAYAAKVSDWILVFSVLGEESKVVAAIKAGAQGYLLKGGPPAELLRAIRQVAEGHAPISPSIARHLLKILREPEVPKSGALVPLLTNREVQVLELIAQGFINSEIAVRLAIAPYTVSTHVRNVYQKLEVHARGQAVTKGRDLGILSRGHP